jgi:hypothetical protein
MSSPHRTHLPTTPRCPTVHWGVVDESIVRSYGVDRSTAQAHRTLVRCGSHDVPDGSHTGAEWIARRWAADRTNVRDGSHEGAESIARRAESIARRWAADHTPCRVDRTRVGCGPHVVPGRSHEGGLWTTRRAKPIARGWAVDRTRVRCGSHDVRGRSLDGTRSIAREARWITRGYGALTPDCGVGRAMMRSRSHDGARGSLRGAERIAPPCQAHRCRFPCRSYHGVRCTVSKCGASNSIVHGAHRVERSTLLTSTHRSGARSGRRLPDHDCADNEMPAQVGFARSAFD